MMSIPLRALIVEDVEDDALMLVRHLERGGYDLTFERVDTEAACLSALERETWDAILCDYTLPGFGGLEVLAIYKEKGLDMPFIIVSGTIGEDVAVEAMKAGAHDYVMKQNLMRLAPAIQRELRETEVRRERRRVEEALRQSEKEFMDVLHSSGDAILLIDGDTFVDCNEATAQMLGYSNRNDFLMTHPSELSPPVQPDGRSSFEKANDMMQLAVEKGFHRFEWMHRKANGEDFPVEVSLAPVVHAGKLALHCVWRDITRRKLADEALRESEGRYRTITESVNLGVSLIDVNHKIIMANSFFAKLFKKPAADFVGRHCFAEFEKRSTICPHCPGVLTMSSGKPEQVETEGVRDDGSRFNVLLRTIPTFASDGAVSGFIEVIEDITDRKSAETNKEKVLRRQQGISKLQQSLLTPTSLEDKLKKVTDAIVRLFDADFCRIWLTRPGDRCEAGCIHAEVKEGPHVCRYRDRCLHLLASSGRYTHTDGTGHRRVPFGCYKIGLVASGEENKFITNDAPNDPRVHNHEWVRELGLVSFAGYQLRVPGGETLGVLALFAKHTISVDEDAILEGIGSTVALVVKQTVAQESLQRSEMKFRTLYDSTGDAVMLLDEQGFFDCNKVTPAMFGCATREEFCSKHPADVSPPQQPCGTDSFTLANQRTATAMENGSNRFEWIHRRVDTGELFPVEVLLSALELDGRPVVQAVVRDITERKRAENEIRRITAAINATSDAIAMSTADGHHFYQNGAFGRLFGYTLEEVVRLQPAKLFADEDVAKKMFETIMAGESWNSETEMVAKDSRRFPASLRADAVKDERGNVMGLVGVFTDITERKRIEDALRASEAEHRMLFESAGVGIIYVDLDKRVLLLNSLAAAQLGGKPEDHIGKTGAEIFPPEVADTFNMLVDEVSKTNASAESEDMIPSPDGPRWYFSKYVSIREPNGTPIGVQIVTTDITDRKTFETALRLDAERMQALLDLNRWSEADPREIVSHAVEAGIRLSGSKLGYFATLSDDESVLTMEYWSRGAMKECAIIDKPIVYQVAEIGLWGEAVRQRQPVITNDYAAANPLKKGYPDVHVQVTRHMNVPVFDGGRIVAVAGVGNKASDYGESDARQLQVLLEAAWRIIDRGQTERALKESEERFRTLIKNQGEGIGIVDVEERFNFANPAAERVFGVEPGALIGRTVLEFVDHATASLIQTQSGERSNGKSSTYEVEIMRPSGERRALLITATPQMDEAGRFTGSFGVFRDITERKRADEALRASQQMLEGIINAIPVRVFWKDRNLVYLGCNAIFAGDAGYADPKDVIGKDDYQMSWRDQAGLHRDDDRQVVESGCPKLLIEESQTTPKGNTITLLTSKMPLRDANGEITGLLGTYVDITERKQAEAAVINARDFYLTLFEDFPALIWRSGADRLFNYFNQTWLDFTGRSIEHEFGNGWLEGIHPDDRDSFIETYTQAFDDRRPFEFEHRLRFHEAGYCWVLNMGRPFYDLSGDFSGFIGSCYDISERKDAEERLKLQANVLSQVNDAVIAVDNDYQITYVNTAAEVLYDAVGEQEGRELDDIFEVRWLKPHDKEDFDNGLATQGLWHGRAAHIKSSGKEIYVELVASILKNSENIDSGLLLIIRDITGQRAAEDALKESDRLLSTLLGNLPGMVYRCRNDVDRTMEYLSKGCQSLTGFAPEDLIGNKRLSYSGLIHPNDAEQVRRQLQQSLGKENAYKLTYRIVTRSGAEKWVWEQGWIESIFEQGKVVLEGLILDISEQKAEEERRVRLMTAVEQAAEAIVITNTEGTIEYVNPAFTEVTGYTREEAIGQNPRILKSGIHDQAFYRNLWDTLQRGETWKGRIVNKRKDGSLLEEEATLSPVRDTHGKITNYVAVKRDVTQMMALETQLRQAQKLEAVGSLAAGIAHEINTPIQFVGDNTHFLSDAFTELIGLLEKGIKLALSASAATGDQPSPCHDFLSAVDAADFPYLQKEIPHAIEQTLEGVERVATIVRAMRDFSHPDTGEKTTIDINKTLQTTLTVARNEIKYVADVETNFQENLPFVLCHPGALNQVFLNLLVNAAHAIAGVVGDGSGGKGKITVATRTEGDDVVIAISDTGTGIKKDICDRIFDPFFTTKDVGKGTGQGLAIARSVVVEKHGGSLNFETVEGKGTTFLVRLPLMTQEKVMV